MASDWPDAQAMETYVNLDSENMCSSCSMHVECVEATEHLGVVVDHLDSLFKRL